MDPILHVMEPMKQNCTKHEDGKMIFEIFIFSREILQQFILENHHLIFESTKCKKDYIK